MIIREIKSNPEKVLKTFDFFNDYKDTRRWLEVQKRVLEEIIKELDAAKEKQND